MITGPTQDPFRDPIEDPFRDPIADTAPRRTLTERPPGVTADGKYSGKTPGESGIWAFLFFDMWWFTVLFGVTIYTHGDNPQMFEAGRESLTLWEGTLNTLLLLTGSMFVAQAVHAVRKGETDRARRLLAYALLTGAGFIVNKAIEWTHLLGDDHNPGTNDFYQYFFILTGIHLLHLLAGCAGLAYMRKVAARPVIDRTGHRNIEVWATYWHLVDLLWVVIFAVFYLLRS